MKGPNSDSHHGAGISTLVNYLLLVAGLVAEYLSLKTLLKSHLPTGVKSATTIENFIYASVLLVLIHQFLIIRNFHILDHIPKSEYKKNSIGDWVAKSRLEDVIRCILFGLFAVLTGEIVYLFIISSESVKYFHDLIITKDDKYDLSQLTPIYVNAAWIMSGIMLLWDVLGWFHDRNSVPKPGFKNITNEERIVYFPSTSPYYTFFWTDFLSFLFWCIIADMVSHKIEMEELPMLLLKIGALFTFYFFTIALRVYGELRVNFPKILLRLNSYWENTFWWRS